MNIMKIWLIRAGAAAVLLALLFLAGSCNPFNPLAAAGMVDLKIYWVTSDKIYKAYLDGTGIERIYSGSGGPIWNIAIDTLNGKIFWSDPTSPDPKIYSANLDGSDAKSILSRSAIDLALDVENGKLYYVETTGIHRCNLDGTDPKSFVTPFPMLLTIDLDWTTGNIYWSTGGDIYRSNISSPLSYTQIYSSGGAEWITEIELDVAGGKMYWFDNTNFVLKQANLDGTGSKTVATSVNALGLELDPHESKIYWTEDTVPAPGYTLIKRVNADGSGMETFLSHTDADQAYGLVLDLWP